MPYVLQNVPAATRAGRASCFDRCAPSLVVLALACGVGLSGCNHNPPGLVAVSGKLTLDGGAWPKSGQINFSPVKPLPGHALLPAMARVNDDGSFAILTPSAPGLLPGEYNVAVVCWREAPDDRRRGKSALAERYGSPLTSGLKVSVPEGSAPIVLNWDIQSQ